MIRSLFIAVIFLLIRYSGYSQTDTVKVQLDTTQYVLIPLQTIRDINENDARCDTIQKRFKQISRLYSLQKIELKQYKRLDLNSQKIERSSIAIEGVYQNSQVIIKQIKPPKTFIGKVWGFTTNYVIPAVAVFSAGYFTGKGT